MALERTFIGKGKVYLGPYGGGARMRDIGNCSVLNFVIDEDTKSALDFQAAGGGKVNELRRIQDVQVQMTMYDYLYENLALAVLGDASQVAAGSATDEAHTAYLDGFIPTAHANISSVVVTDDPETAPYTAGTDYEARSGGVWVPAGSSIPDGSGVLIDYAYSDQNVIEAVRNSPAEKVMVFDGLNEAQSGDPMRVTIHRLKFGPTNNLPLIGDDYAQPQLTGEALKDPNKTGGESAFFKVEQVGG